MNTIIAKPRLRHAAIAMMDGMASRIGEPAQAVDADLREQGLIRP